MAIGRDEEALRMCAKARALEEAGSYERARLALHKWWQQIPERPNLDGLSRVVAATVLLRVGRLSGWLNNIRALPAAQEIARDYISEALSVFEESNDIEQAAEAENALAICYFRDGAFDEARVYLRRAKERLRDTADVLRLSIVINQAMVERVDGKHRSAYTILRRIIPQVEECQNYALQARLHNELALYHKHQGNTDNALMEFTACGYYLEKAGHLNFLAILKNNVGALKLNIGRLSEAHEDLRQAERLFSSLKDKSGLALTFETRARVCLAECRFEEAELAACRAVSLVEDSSDMALLVENLTTWARTLARLDRADDARSAFSKARVIALEFLGSKKAVEIGIMLVEELLAPIFGEFEVPLDEGLLRLERRIIKNTLEETGDKLTVAGMKLGVTKQNLSYKLKFRHPTLQR